MTTERYELRTGALCATLGVLLAVGAAMLGPMDLDPHDLEAVLE